MRIVINGFGRIGRTFLRTLIADSRTHGAIDVAVINIGPTSPELGVHLFKYDTLMGAFDGLVELHNDTLRINDRRIKIVAEPDPDKLDWKSYGIDWVVDASGRFTHRAMAEKHIKAGAQGVLISAPAYNEDITIVMGVNEQKFDRSTHKIVSIGSCTTNAIVPMLSVLDESFGIVSGSMTTIHAYTNTQVLIDVGCKDARRSRAAVINIIPTGTGAANLIGKILPQLQGKVTATAVRVPVSKVSLIDLVFTAKNPITVQDINDACKKAQSGRLAGVMSVTSEPLVSSDFSGDSHSVIIDSLLTQVADTTGQLFGWYDNEWGYSERLKDFLIKCAL